ncbi:hypothetical protein KsCSTR_35140 [Candidatus Kuenenia stuttgartiensis]|uniref:Uncharacterized protein n=1 Tax=Kuenenia stuttgartiensis TaxID=174633 RepID=A0A6G7GU97_KUEST|nr:hypothetical protein KsCSTR_35140 [Candidatus Kuenenia stuttgartiensis]
MTIHLEKIRNCANIAFKKKNKICCYTNYSIVNLSNKAVFT